MNPQNNSNATSHTRTSGPGTPPEKAPEKGFFQSAEDMLSKLPDLDWSRDDWNKQLDGLHARAKEARTAMTAYYKWMEAHKSPLELWESYKKLAVGRVSNVLYPVIPSLPAATLYSMQLGAHLHSHYYVWPQPPIPVPNLGPILWMTNYEVLINGLPAANQESMGITAPCGGWFPFFSLKTGSSSVMIGDKRATRMSDVTAVCEVPEAEEPSTLMQDLLTLGVITDAERVSTWLNRLNLAYNLVDKPYQAWKAFTEHGLTKDSQALADLLDAREKETDPLRKQALDFQIQATREKLQRTTVRTLVGWTRAVAGMLAKPTLPGDLMIGLWKGYQFLLTRGGRFLGPAGLLLITHLKNSLMPLLRKWFALATMLKKVLEDRKVIDGFHMVLAACSPNVLIGGFPFNDDWIDFTKLARFVIHRQATGAIAALNLPTRSTAAGA